MEVTTGQLRNGVVLAVQAAFPVCEVYAETAPETAVKPYLVVGLQSQTQQPELNRRYRWTYTFDVRYVPDTTVGGDTAADRLTEALKRIAPEPGSPFRGGGIRHEWKEGVLHVAVDYTFRVVAARTEETFMQQLVQEGGLKL
ncbi:DUF6838 family protein [Paenibacillus hodogayensis]|uniref:DUF6838 family protein n=1 Tax=Paenibacillus hodogayensis TaxID=279208 RepID=A0ABV5W1B6_9BACL